MVINILYVVLRANIGGLQTTLRNRIHALNACGIKAEVGFLARGDGESIFAGIPHFFIESVSQFQKKIRNGNYQVISFIYALDYLQHVPKSYNGKIIYEVRGWNYQIESYVKNLDKYGKVDAILCIAKYLKLKVKQQLTRDVPIYVDGNAMDPMFHYVAPSSRVWKKCPVPRDNYKIIAYVGRVEGSKNWRQFLCICAKVRRAEKIELWIICNRDTSKDFTRLMKKCAQLGLTSVTRVLAYVPNEYMPEVYSVIKDSGGCILSTSTREGLGNHILEPLACGLPVVSSNVPGKNEIITHRCNGMLYQLDDTGRAVRYVKEVIRNRTLRNTLKRNGLRTIRRHYSPSGYAKRYESILSKL